MLTAAGGLDSSTYKVLNPSSFTYTTNATPTAVTITPITATPLAAAYWIGGFSGLPGVWSASDGSGAGNWTTDGLGTASPLVPGPTANVFFSDASASAVVQAAMSLGSNMSVGSLTFNSTNPATLLNTDASVLSLASGLTVNAPAAAVTLSANIATTAAQSWTNNSANPLITGLVSNGANLLTLSGSGNTTIGNFNGGTGGLTVDSTGFTALSASTLAGAQTWANNSVNTLTAGAIANAGFALTLAGTGNFDLGGVVSGTGTLTKAGNAATTAATGTVNQTGGAISFTAGNQVLVGQNTVGNQGVYNMSGGSITTFASATRGVMLGVNTNPAPGPASGGGTFNLSGTAVLNMISGGNSILQIGRSDVVANNTTNVFNQTGGAASVGILAMGGAAASGSTGVSSTLSLTGGTFSANSFTVLSAGGNNDSFINIGGTADVTLPAFPPVRGAISTATLTLDGGTLRPSAASATYLSGLTNAFIQAGGANFDVPTGRNITVSQSLLTDLVSLGGGLSKSGVGVLTLSGANTYTGSTTVSAGGLVARNLASLPGIATLHQISLSGSSTLTLGVGGVGEFASTDVDTVLTNADFNTGTALGFDTANAAGGFTYATNISNASGVAGTNLGVAKSGANTLVLSGANTYSGPTTITGGILEIAVSNNLGDASPTNSIILAGGTFSSGASAFTLDNTRPVSITASSGFRAEILGTLTITTDLANGATIISSDSGLLTLNGSLTATAATRQLQVRGNGAGVINGVINGVISNGLTVNMPVLKDGGSGTWTFNGANTYSGATTVSATVAATSNLALQLGGTGVRGTAYDTVTVNSALALDGTITVTLNGLVPAATQTFDLIDSTGAINVAGFDVNTDLVLPPLDPGLAWDTSTFATDGQITVVVDLDPFTAWATANSVEGGKGGDEDGDGTTNLVEFATNANPQSGSSGARVYGLVHPIGGSPVLTYTVATRAAAILAPNGSRQEATKDLVKYSIEGTNDLSIWNSVVVTEVTGGDATAVRAAIVPALPTLDSGWEWHTFRTDDNTAVDPSDFIRLNVTEAP